MKFALYGIYKSKIPLRFWLPHSSSESALRSSNRANSWFETLVFCEVNEKRGPKECQMVSDLDFTVGGVSASSVQITNAASYLKKHICINVNIPSEALITKRRNVESSGSNTKKVPEEIRNGGNEDDVGLIVDVIVQSNSVTRDNGACSISHVIWQSI